MFDFIRRLGDVSGNSVVLRERIISTYFWLRIGMLVIAFVFPFLLVGVGWLGYGVPWQDSMSAYYWAPIEKEEEGGDAPMRVWFVGLLFALGSCLFLYKGYTWVEDWMLNIAAGCAICVAVIPMCWDRWSECPSWRSLHGVFAIVFFVLLALVAVLYGLWALALLRPGPHWRLEDRTFLGRLREIVRYALELLRLRPLRRLEDRPLEDPRSFIYATLYVVTAAVMVLAPGLTWIFWNKIFETNPARTFWAEVAGIVAFCLFWLVQIRQIRRSQFDRDLAKSDSESPGGHGEPH